MKRALLPLIVLLSGCAIPATNQHVVAVSGPSLGLGTATAAPVSARWWQGFGDPQLDRIIADAVAGNPSLDAALARLSSASAMLDIQRANDGPNVGLDAEVQAARLSGRYTIPPPYAGSTRSIASAAFNLGWNLDLFGRQKSAIRAASASADAAALDIDAARLAITGSVVQTYIDLARAQDSGAIAARAIATRQDALRLINIRIRNELASDLDAQAATVLLAQARQAQLRAQAQATLAKNALAALAGRGPDYAAAIKPAAINLDAGLVVADTIPADLLARRADIAAAQARITAAMQGRVAAQRAFYPDINLGATAGLQAIGIGNFFSTDAAMVGVGPALHLPIFDNGRLKAGLAGASASLDLATASYNEKVVAAAHEAADAIARIAATEADRKQQRDIVAGFTKTGKLNAIRVASGLDSRLGLVDNDVRLLDAELAAANLAADAAQQRTRLALALGGGFGDSK